MATVSETFCDRCGVTIVLVNYNIVVSKVVSGSTPSRSYSKDLCGECVLDFDNWLLTGPDDDGTVVATDNP